MTYMEVRSFKLAYPENPPFWLDLCDNCLGKRLINGASILEKRKPVTASRCSDCDPKASLR